MSFQLRGVRDGLARIGKLTTKHGTVETPLLMPVINPKQLHDVTIEDLKETGMKMLITNSYIIWKSPKLKEKALKEGLHSLVGFDGPIMTDSGAFQLMVYGDVEVSNEEITAFQEKMGSDIGVILDIPLAKGNWDLFNEALDTTLSRADEHIAIRSEDTIQWAGPIQGGRFLDLVEKSAKEMGKRDFNIHAIGSVVPLMEKYDYKTVVQMILTTKMNLPPSRAVHLFGAGHPMLFALAVYLGIDLFDSAAYILFAKQGRYLSVDGTQHLDDIEYLSCTCPICSKITAQEFKKLPNSEKVKKLAKHNLYISFQEIETIKQAIMEGRLLNLVYSRCVRHPALYEAFKHILTPESVELLEQYEQASKSRALFISHPDLVNHPLVYRYRKRISERFLQTNDNIYLLDGDTINWPLPGVKDGQVILIDRLFGPIPSEIQTMYPLLQHLKVNIDTTHIKDVLQQFFSQLREGTKIFYQEGLETKYDLPIGSEPFEELEKSRLSSKNRVKGLIEYQFGKNASNALTDFKVEFSKKTNVLRRILSTNGDLLATIRPDDFFIIPQIPLCELLLTNTEIPTNRIIAHDDVIPFILDKKSLFSKHVLEVDPDIRVGDEILIVNKQDKLIATGTAIMSAKEMKSFEQGIAVKTRRAVKNFEN